MAVKAKLTPMAGALASATMILGLAATPAHGAGNREATAPSAATSSSQARSAATGLQSANDDLRASKLMGKDVRNSEGEELGEIEDFVIDLSNDRIHYVVLARGGVLGLGEKHLAVPVGQLQGDARDHELILNMTKQQLKDAPRLDRNVEWSDPRTWDNVGQYYTRTLGMPASDQPAARSAPRGQAPAAASRSPEGRLFRASDVLGMDVVDSTGDEVGEVEDMVVDLKSGQIRYVVLEFDRAWNPNDKLVALPLSSFRPQADRNDLLINMSREQLANAPSFEKRDWPDLRDRQFRDRVAGFGRSSATGMDSRSPVDPNLVAIVIIDDPQFVRLDTDRDGRLSRDEAKAFTRLTEHWSAVDRNGDGYLTRDELNRYPGNASTSSGASAAGSGTAGGRQDAMSDSGKSQSGATGYGSPGSGPGSQPR